MKWEYEITYLINPDEIAEYELLTHKGECGWELTAVVRGMHEMRLDNYLQSYYFKRPKQETIAESPTLSNIKSESLLDDKITIIRGRPFEEILEENEGHDDNNNPRFRCPPNMDDKI